MFSVTVKKDPDTTGDVVCLGTKRETDTEPVETQVTTNKITSMELKKQQELTHKREGDERCVIFKFRICRIVLIIHKHPVSNPKRWNVLTMPYACKKW